MRWQDIPHVKSVRVTVEVNDLNATTYGTITHLQTDLHLDYFHPKHDGEAVLRLVNDVKAFLKTADSTEKVSISGV